MRGVPGLRVDGGTARGEMLLSDSAHVHVEDYGADGVDALTHCDGLAIAIEKKEQVMHQATDQATDRATNQSSMAKSSWRSAAKTGARWLSGCMRRMSTRTVQS